MKIKTTKKAMKESYDTILSIGYCNLQNLLKFETEIAYSSRAEGWACDYYEVNNVCISTGYSPIGKSVSYETTKKYDGMAEKIICDSSIPYDKKQMKVHDLLVEFINEVTA